MISIPANLTSAKRVRHWLFMHSIRNGYESTYHTITLTLRCSGKEINKLKGTLRGKNRTYLLCGCPGLYQNSNS